MSQVEEEKIDEAVRGAAQEMSSDGAVVLTGRRLEERLDACLQRLGINLHGAAVQRNRSWNHTCPVYRIPPEILVEVLSLALQDDLPDPPFYMERLQMFACVSHQWLLLAKETPSLWNIVSSDMPLELLQQVLSRSAGHSLDVVLTWSHLDDIPRDLFTTLVVEHVHRWRSLSVIEQMYDKEWNEIFQRLEDLSAPALEVLICHKKLPQKTAVNIFRGGPCRLRCVDLQNFCIPWESKILSGLQELYLQELAPSCPSAVQLLAILAASPCLIRLSLQRLHPRNHHHSTPPQKILVKLPMLEAMTIDHTSQELTHSLLAGIHILKRVSLQFSITYQQRYDTHLGLFNDPELVHITSVLVAYFRTCQYIVISWSSRGKLLLLRGTSTGVMKLDLSASGNGVWSKTAPAGLSNALEEAEPSDIHLGFSEGNSPSTILLQLRSSQHRVTEITLFRLGADEPTSMMQFLATPTIVDGIAQWPFPRLRDLSIVYSEFDQRSFVDAILSSSRYRGVSEGEEGGMNDGGVPEPCVPVHLTVKESMDYAGQCLDAEGGEELRRFLGNSNFTYTLKPQKR